MFLVVLSVLLRCSVQADESTATSRGRRSEAVSVPSGDLSNDATGGRDEYWLEGDDTTLEISSLASSALRAS